MSDEVRFFRECETCKGSGVQPEEHAPWAIEYLSCQDCRGTGAGREVRLEGGWVCRNTEDGECVEWDHAYHDERGWSCGWYLREVPDGQ